MAQETATEAATMTSAPPDPGVMAPGPLFVVGMWRSGTSLLYALLNQNPRIGLMYESDMLTLSPLFFIPRKSAWWLNKVDAWNGALTRHKIDPAAIDKDITDLPNAFRAVAEQYAKAKGATVWGCKSPTYYDCMNQVADWYPQAKFIVIWRDPADVCRSIVRAAVKAPWFARPGMDLRAILGYRRMKQEADELVRRGAAVYQLQYDDLVRDPEPTLRAICDFVGIPFDPKMASLEGADRSAVYNGEHHAGVKSSAIVAKRERAEVLAPELKNKVERYVVYWRKQSAGQWPVNAAVSDGTPAASLFERTSDRIRHRILRTRDLFVPYAYALVPVSLWQKYRKVKSRYQDVAPKPPQTEVSS
ncbi:MAG TPA: sulfotransferase [Candidatus Dormibacteraeota bacterium]|nr:sulfotransferase [Candidatus Dormibacteraeota bacterium]